MEEFLLLLFQNERHTWVVYCGQTRHDSDASHLTVWCIVMQASNISYKHATQHVLRVCGYLL